MPSPARGGLRSERRVSARIVPAPGISRYAFIRYTFWVTKRLVDIEDDLLTRARELGGATTMKDAVNTALRSFIDTELRRRHLRRLETGEGTDLGDDEVMQGAWR